MKKNKIGSEDIKKHYGYLVVDGEYFKLDTSGKETIFKKVKLSEFKKKIKLMEDLAKKLKESLDGELVMMEALGRLEIEELEPIHNEVFNIKKKVKVVTRKHHCVDMKIGEHIISIVD